MSVEYQCNSGWPSQDRWIVGKQLVDSKIVREQLEDQMQEKYMKEIDPALILAPHQVGEGKPELLDDWDQRLVVSFCHFEHITFFGERIIVICIT